MGATSGTEGSSKPSQPPRPPKPAGGREWTWALVNSLLVIATGVVVNIATESMTNALAWLALLILAPASAVATVLLARAGEDRASPGHHLRHFAPWRSRKRRYRTAVRERYGHVVQPWSVDIDLGELFVPPTVTGRDGTPRDAVDVVGDDGPNVLLLGAPGAGKTLLLRYVLLHHVSRRPMNRVPVLLELRDVAPDQPLETNALAELRQFGVSGDRLLLDALRKGRALLLLDGLDEVVPDRRAELVARVREFAKRHPGNKVVLSCRSAAFSGELDPGFSRVCTLRDISGSQLRSLLDNHTKALGEEATERVRALLLRHPRLAEVLRTPVLAGMVANLAAVPGAVEAPDDDHDLGLDDDSGPGGGLPRQLRRTDVYHALITRVLARRPQTVGPVERFAPLEKRGLLRALALASRGGAETSRMSTLRARDLAAEVLRLHHLDPGEAADLLTEVVQRTGLLHHSPDGQFISFPHVSLPEYLAAEALRDKPDDLLRHYRADPQTWAETVRFWCGLQDEDTASFVSEIARDDALLALDCVVESHTVDSELPRTLVDHIRWELRGYPALPWRKLAPVDPGDAVSEERAVRAVANALADHRPFSWELAHGLRFVLHKPPDPASRKLAVLRRALVRSRNPSALHELFDYDHLVYDDNGEEYVKAQPTHVVRLLAAEGDDVVPILRRLAVDGSGVLDQYYGEGQVESAGSFHLAGATEVLFHIGTPRAAGALADVLLNSVDFTARCHAAWYLADLLREPSIEVALRRTVRDVEPPESWRHPFVHNLFAMSRHAAVDADSLSFAAMVEQVTHHLDMSMTISTLDPAVELRPDSRIVVPVLLQHIVPKHDWESGRGRARLSELLGTDDPDTAGDRIARLVGGGRTALRLFRALPHDMRQQLLRMPCDQPLSDVLRFAGDSVGALRPFFGTASYWSVSILWLLWGGSLNIAGVLVADEPIPSAWNVVFWGTTVLAVATSLIVTSRDLREVTRWRQLGRAERLRAHGLNLVLATQVNPLITVLLYLGVARTYPTALRVLVTLATVFSTSTWYLVYLLQGWGWAAALTTGLAAAALLLYLTYRVAARHYAAEFLFRRLVRQPLRGRADH
ncbi:NACHT domain-containing protein [Saccharomonospora cyanea]|uniref:Putative NTPase (NACHT family) n=1 Tax=Saccharomonospora cyanea NA-134 TaxID=882082 RepID=H5XJ76_9PSEU|nr:NACHT domain-containing protein [Saccharomonospora cyanea]EHR62886.1 putative NTPase (NACHT family) [Saccharomonospora cyanea NA-134]